MVKLAGVSVPVPPQAGGETTGAWWQDAARLPAVPAKSSAAAAAAKLDEAALRAEAQLLITQAEAVSALSLSSDKSLLVVWFSW